MYSIIVVLSYIARKGTKLSVCQLFHIQLYSSPHSNCFRNTGHSRYSPQPKHSHLPFLSLSAIPLFMSIFSSLSIADSSLVVPQAAGAAAGSVLLLILLCVLALVAVVALKRRMHAQIVKFAEEELHNVTIRDIVLPTSNALRPHSVDEEEDQLQYVMDCSALQHNYTKVNTSSLQPQSIYDDIVLPE